MNCGESMFVVRSLRSLAVQSSKFWVVLRAGLHVILHESYMLRISVPSAYSGKNLRSKVFHCAKLRDGTRDSALALKNTCSPLHASQIRWLFVGEALMLRKDQRISLCLSCYSPHWQSFFCVILRLLWFIFRVFGVFCGF